MPPTGGEGGSNAIRDAAQLTQHIIKVCESDSPLDILSMEVSAYESDILKWSSSSVGRSMRFSGMITAEGWVYPYFIRFFLKIVNFFIGVKR